MRVCTVAAIAILCLSQTGPSQADMEMAPSPHVTASDFGRFYFKMVPDGDREAGGNGFLYMVGGDEDELLYTTSGWYAPKVYVSLRGRYICRIGNGGRIGDWYFKDRIANYKPKDRLIARCPEEHIAIAFYDRGKEFRAYTVSDLIPDTENLQFSRSHYSFIKSTRYQREPMGDSHGYWIIVETVDDQVIVFNMETGVRKGGKELVKAFLMSEKDALGIAKGYLSENGLEGGVLSGIYAAEDFTYRMNNTQDGVTQKVVVDRRTGAVELE